jgi:hypothetical protein
MVPQSTLLAPMKNGEPIVVTTKRLRRVLFVAALAAAFSVTPAFAEPSSAPLDALSMQVQPTLSAILISGRLAQAATLPATLSLPIPSGAKPYWVGEIVGTDPSKDPKATYTIEKAKGYDLVVFTIKQGRTGQVEMSIATPVAGAPSTLSYSLPIVSKVAQATLSFGLPAGSTLSTSTPGLVGGVGASGESLFTKTVQNPKVGSTIKESLTYSVTGIAGGVTAGGASTSGATSGSAADALAIPLWILVLVFAGLFVKAVIGRRRAAMGSGATAADHVAGDSAFDEDDAPSRPKSAKAAPAKRAAATAGASTKPRTAATPRARRPQDA